MTENGPQVGSEAPEVAEPPAVAETSAAAAAPTVAKEPPRRGKSRVWEWLWRGEALRAARGVPGQNREVVLTASRARIAAEVGAYALHPSGPWASGNAQHLACQLFAESIGWSLRLASGERSVAPEMARPANREELSTLLETQAALLARGGVSGPQLDALRQALLVRDFELLATPQAEIERTARQLKRVAERLLQLAQAPQTAIDRVLFQRAWRIALLLIVLLGGAVYGFLLRDRIEADADLSRNKPWVASSTYETVCKSPKRSCESDKGYFFHTLDEANPWLELDLKRAQQFSTVRVYNRTDCCSERTVPLLVEVSTDHEHWREVARKPEAFDQWKAHFSPVTARWVRLRIAGHTMLHLSGVRVLP